MERTNRIEHQKVTQNRCFRSDGFCRWSGIFFSLGSRNIVSRNGKVGLRELVGCENPIKTVFWIIAWQLRKCSCPVTIFGIFPSLSMSREMSAENAYTQGFRDLCLDGILIIIDRSLRNPVKYPSKRSGPRSGGALHLGMIPYLTSDVTGKFHPTTNCRRKNHHHQNSSSEHPKAPELREFCLGWINFVIRSQIPSVWAKKWVEMACRGKIWATRYISDYIFSGHSEVSQK